MVAEIYMNDPDTQDRGFYVDLLTKITGRPRKYWCRFKVNRLRRLFKEKQIERRRSLSQHLIKQNKAA